jgi:hypothetical protein
MRMEADSELRQDILQSRKQSCGLSIENLTAAALLVSGSELHLLKRLHVRLLLVGNRGRRSFSVAGLYRDAVERR